MIILCLDQTIGKSRFRKTSEKQKMEIERKVQEIIKEIRSLPEEKVKAIKREVFCTEVCEETYHEFCEEN